MNRSLPTSRLLALAAAILLPLVLIGLFISAFVVPGIARVVPASPTPTAMLPLAAARAVPPSATATLRPSPTASTTPSATPSATAVVLPPTETPATAQSPTTAPTPTELPVETPAPQAWLHRHTAHYDLYYLPGSPAAADSDKLASMAEDALTWAANRLQAPPTVRIAIYFVNRIYWQGGASYSHNELLISYPPQDREYTSTSLMLVLRHETTHALVEQMLGSDAHKGGLLGEGVAVWDAGGHYQTENLDVLASTLVAENADLYIPLTTLRSDFYDAQHELAYLEGGAYVKFLIDRWGLAKFKQYLDHPDDPQPIYGLDSDGLERAWRTALAAVKHSADDVTAVRLRVRYYDLMRRYESTLDPDARVLPNQPPSQWGPTLIALFSHPAAGAPNVRIEQEFVQAGTALWSRDLATCARLLADLAAQINDMD